MKVMGLLGLYDVTEKELSEAVRQERLLPREAERVRRYCRGGAESSSLWLERLMLSGYGGSRHSAKGFARELEQREAYARLACDASIRSGGPHEAYIGLTVTLDRDGRNIAGPCGAISPEDFTVIADDGRGERVTLRYEDIKDAGHYNRKD